MEALHVSISAYIRRELKNDFLQGLRNPLESLLIALMKRDLCCHGRAGQSESALLL